MENKEDLINAIEEAFKGVTLDDGIGLYEAQAIDSYMDETVRKQYRQKDETIDWKAISKGKLEECYSSPSFFDAKGMRFHLPAFMICQLKYDEFDGDIVGHLINFWHNDKPVRLQERFDILTPKQRNAVCRFLIEMVNEEYHLKEEIQKALETYWTA